jgi:hypothetical protein
VSGSCRSHSSVELLVALGFIALLTAPGTVGAADQTQPTNQPAGVVDQYTPDFPGPPLSRILTDKELERITHNLPSLYRIRNAPSDRPDPIWSRDDAAAMQSANRVNRRIGRDVRRLDNSIRSMNITINRTRNIRRSRGF